MRTSLNPFLLAVPSGGAQLLPYTEGRVGLIFSSGPTMRYTLSFRGPTNLDEGVNVPANSKALELWADDVGDAIVQAVWVQAQAIGQVVSGWEVIRL
jgi:hypothetical protein